MSGIVARGHARHDVKNPRWRPRSALGRLGLVVALVSFGQAVVSPNEAFAAVALTVTTTADIATTAGDCGSSSTAIPSPLTLREATCIATNYGNSQAVTINIPIGHYTLTNGELQPGKVAGSNVSLVGAGSASTIIDGGNNSRVLDFDSSLIGGLSNAVSNLTITGGKDDTFGGAGIIAGSNLETSSDSLTLTNVVVNGNHANVATPNLPNRPGGGIQFEGGQLTITNSTISNNSAGSSNGSGLYYLANGVASPESLTISGSTFSGNSDVLSGGDNAAATGGAVELGGTSASSYHITNSRFIGNTVTSTAGNGSPVGAAIYQKSGILTVTGSTFTGNSVSGGNQSPAGGAIKVEGAGAATLHYDRFTGNVAPVGSAIASDSSVSVNATEDWWGCSTGPGGSGCDAVSGTVNAAPRLVLTATASPSHVLGPNGTATLTGSLLTDSAGGAVGATNLVPAFDGLPVSFSDPPGDATVTVTAGAHSVNLASGAASIDYHSNTTVGPDNDSVTFDNATVTDVLEVDEAPTITSANTAQFTVSGAGTFTVTTTGYPNAAITEAGSLPSGVTFHDNGNGSATVSGTPAAGTGGSYPLNLTANNGVSPNATQTLTVNVGQPPTFTSANSATFTIGSAGKFTVTTSGSPTITESGTLPAGVTFTDNSNGTATIAGTPTGTGNTYPVTLTATNGVSPNATQNLSIQVNQAPAITSNPTDQTVAPGSSVSFTAAASGVPTPTVQWQRSTDSGASFTNIAGATSTTYTFTAAGGDNGNRYRAVFSNAAGSATTTTATLTVGVAPAFTSADHSSFVVGHAGSFAITTTGVPSATLSRTGTQFPAWLTLSDNGDGTGALTGTPPAGSRGSYQFTLAAANGFGTAASQIFTLFVDDSPSITSADHTTLTAGSAGSFAVTTTAGFPTTTALTKTGSLPSGVTFHDNGDGTATLAGTPAAGSGGSYAITIIATAVGGLAAAVTQSFTLTVLAPPSITSANHTTFSEGSVGTFTVTTAAGNPVATTLSSTGTLPSGVSFTDNGDGTATIAGTPNAGSRGVYTITISASNGVGTDDSQSFTMMVNAAPQITSADHTTLTVGAAAAFTVTTTGQPAPALSETGSLPPGVTFTDNGDGTATLGGTPTTGGSYSFTIAAGNSVLPNATQSFTVTVNAAPSMTSADHATFAVDSGGTFTVTTTAGVPAATTLTESGSLPTGVTFHDNGNGTATLAGTPAAGTGGSYSLTIKASNGVGTDPSQAFTLTVHEPTSISSADHATLPLGSPANFTVTTAGGYPKPPVLTETGALPPGMTFTDNGDGTATLGGTPTTGEPYPFTITANNGVAPNASQAFTATVSSTPSITNADHTTFAVGSAGTFTVTTSPGTPAATTLTETGALPSGVTFHDNGNGTATLAGTPAAGSGASYAFTITASNGVLPNTTQNFTLTVTELPAITSANHTTFQVGSAGSFTVTTHAGFPTATTLTEAGSLPSGISFTDNGDGTATVSGTPAAGAGGSYPLTVAAANSAGSVQQSFTLTVVPANASPVITSADHATFAYGSAGSFTVTTTAGYPTDTNLSETGALPAGVSFTDNGDGTATLAGNPTVAGAFPITVKASNGATTDATQSFTLTVTQKPAISSADHTTFTVASAGTFTVSTTPGYPTATTLTESGSLPTGVSFTDNGDGTATIAGTPAAGSGGSYPLTVTATNAAGHTDQAFTLTVVRRGQTITITSIPPSPASVGGSYPLAATSDSGLAVAYSIDAGTTNSACDLSGSTVSFLAAGTCVIDVNQAGDSTFAPATQVQQIISVTKVSTAVSVTTSPNASVYGQSITATASVSADSGTPGGTVQFSVDGTTLGSPVAVSGGAAHSSALAGAGGTPLAPGSHTVAALFTPTDAVTYASSTGSSTQVVNKAATTTILTVHAHDLRAVVAAVTPGSGTPTGTVTFSVGGHSVDTAALASGVATLTYSVPAGKAKMVAAAYSGDANFTASSVSTTRRDPKITAQISSVHPRSNAGWYRSSVTVTFTCTATSAPLTGPCPARVVLQHQGAAQSLTRTVTAIDGGETTVVVSAINIDLTAPRVSIAGVRNGATYDGAAPRARCVAADQLSGVASCRLTQTVRGTQTTYHATATDRAGNTAQTSATITVLAYYLTGATYLNGAFTVHTGRVYTLVVNGTAHRPVYYDAAVYPRQPSGRDNAFRWSGHNRWTLGVLMQKSLRTHPYWNIGIRVGATMHVIRIRIS